MSVVHSTLSRHPARALLLVPSVIVHGQNLSLDLTDQWGPHQTEDACTNGTGMSVNAVTGEILGLRCRRNSCLYCVRGKVARIGRAVRYSRPTALLTFTGLTGTYRTDADQINLLLKYLRRDGETIHMVWAAESNPNGTGTHAHAWSHGDPPSSQRLNCRASQVGIGVCQVKSVTHTRNFGYIAKTATWNDRSLAAFRVLNGSELVHGRTFWRDPGTGERLSLTKAATRQRTLDLEGLKRS
jgi:hypothetical protein